MSFLRTRNVLHGFLQKNNKALICIEGEQLQALQACELEMFRDINDLCFRENIPLMVGGGTLLGAVRHKGFIPWDDDIDLMLPRSYVDRFVKLVKSEFADRYTMQYHDGRMTNGFMKIRKKGTTYIEVGEETLPENNGVYLDVFIIENVPDQPLYNKLYGYLCNLRLYIATSVLIRQSTSDAYWTLLRQNKDAERNYKFRSALGFFFSWRNFDGWFRSNDKFFSRYSDRTTKRVSIITGRGHYFGEMFPREVYAETCELPFEDMTVKAPRQYTTYLRQMYGENYMQLPPEDKREHHYVIDMKL